MQLFRTTGPSFPNGTAMRFVSIQQWRPIWGSFLIIGLVVLCGCSKEELVTMTSTMQQKAKEAIAEVNEIPVVADILPPQGSGQVQLTTPVAIQTAYVRFYPVGEGRPSVIQWTSYDPEAGPETYPALLVRATTSASTLDQIVDQTLPSEIYFQASKDADVLSLPLGSFIDLTVARSQPNSKLVLATVAAGELYDPSGARHAISGITIEGVDL